MTPTLVETAEEKLKREFTALAAEPTVGNYANHKVEIILKGGEPIVEQKNDSELCRVLCGHGPLYSHAAFHRDTAGFLDVAYVLSHWSQIEHFFEERVLKEGHSYNKSLNDNQSEHQASFKIGLAFYDALKQYRARAERYQKLMVEAGIFTFSGYVEYLKSQVKVLHVAEYKGQLIGGLIHETEMERTWRGMIFSVKLIMAEVRDDGTPVGGTLNYVMSPWQGLKPLSEIPLRKPTEEEIETLRIRGERYLELSTKPEYVNITSGFVVHPWSGAQMPLVCAGRAVVDQPGSLTSGTFFQNIGFLDDVDHDEFGEHVSPVLMPPFLNVFSMRLDAWVGVYVDDVKPIIFRDDAFDNLVMDENLKRDIQMLTTSVDKGVDFVDGKSGGTIFLMDGPPGVGKTLTAETVSETLRKPLYRVNIGTLGTTPKTVEEGLANILKLAERWEAVLLLDEADVFLEARNAADIVRNAIVCVFLRMIEYYKGVLFLTTNRGAHLDPAVLSRVTYRVPLDNLKAHQRAAIWHNLSALYEDRFDSITSEGWKQLAEIPLNGREIKNFLRVANAVAGETATTEDIIGVIARQRPEVTQDLVAVPA